MALTQQEMYQRVKRITDSFGKTEAFDVRQYEAAFAESGREKGDHISNQLLELAAEKGLDLSKFAYFSIGGCEGSEIETVLSRTPISNAILLEYHSDFCDSARKRATKLEPPSQWVIIGGDATLHLDQAVEKLRTWRSEQGLQGVVLSVQAVLHELPTRSLGFDLANLVGKVFSGWEHRVFTSREPCAPALWPQDVALTVPLLSSTELHTLATVVQKALDIPGSVLEQRDHEVRMPSALAVEVLTKLFYIDSFAHEIQERVTHFTPLELIRGIEHHLGTNTVTSELICSKGFARNYRALGVSACVPSGIRHNVCPPGPLPLPACFVRMFGYGRPALKPLSPLSLENISNGAHSIAELHQRGVSIDWLTKALYALDLQVFPDITQEHAGQENEWVKILEKHPEDYSVFFEDRKPVGYWHAMPLEDDAFDKMMAGTLSDGDIRLKDVANYDMPGDYSLYFLCVATDSRVRLRGSWHLNQSFLQHLKQLADSGHFIRRMCANAFTDSGEKLCKKVGMAMIRPHQDSGKIYLLETGGLISWLRSSRSTELADRYAEHFDL